VLLAYKIRRKGDGLFSSGGSVPLFSKTGKTWTSKNALANHLRLVWDTNPGGYDRDLRRM
jgi:hypothetical protein